LPGAYELHLPADDVTIWYTVTEHEGRAARPGLAATRT
jgi:hypothetical protein